jgi:hypothetical protein
VVSILILLTLILEKDLNKLVLNKKEHSVSSKTDTRILKLLLLNHNKDRKEFSPSKKGINFNGNLTNQNSNTNTTSSISIGNITGTKIFNFKLKKN